MTAPKHSEITLKTCPFCGGEAYIREYGEREFHTVLVICRTCHASVMTRKRETVIELWNTRAATTIGKVHVEVAPTVRTCKPVEKDGVMHCPECDYPLGIMSVPAFCAGCGAKVVEK